MLLESFPGLRVEDLPDGEGWAFELVQFTNGRADVDVIDSQLGYVELLLGRGLLEPYPWHEKLGIDRDRLLYDNRAVIAWHLDTPLAININLVKPSEIKSWDDVLAAEQPARAMPRQPPGGNAGHSASVLAKSLFER